MKANQKIKTLREDSSGLAKIIGGLVAFLVAIIIGILVFYSVNDNLSYSMWMGSGHAAAWNNTNTTASTVWTLLPIIGIVVIAGIILAVIIGFGGGKRGGL